MFELTLQVIIKMKRHSLVRITMFFKKIKITFSKLIYVHFKTPGNCYHFSNKTGEHFNVAEIFRNLSVQL